jgi:hypothetical protein
MDDWGKRRLNSRCEGKTMNMKICLMPLIRFAFRRMTCHLCIAVFMVFILMNIFCDCCLAQGLASWNQFFLSPVQITSMAYGNGTFIGVGDGLRFISYNGSNWAAYATPPIDVWHVT